MIAKTPRPKTAIDQAADAFTARMLAVSPLLATAFGVPGQDHLLDDFSPDGIAEKAGLERAVLREIADLEPLDDTDRVTVAALRERLDLSLEMEEAGETYAALNNLASPVQELRSIFDLMPKDGDEAWANIAGRLTAVSGAIDGLIDSYREGARRGVVAAIRQVEEGARQATELAGEGSFFTKLIASADAPASLSADLERGATAARAAYGRLAAFFTDELAAQAPTADAVGKERYARASRYFLGAAVDLEETYEWGREELARIIAEQTEVAAQIAGPGASVEDAVAALDADQGRKLQGTEALQQWMQATADQAMRDLDGTHFDIDDRVKTIEGCIASTPSGAIYYTPPSDDFSRPGRMWWSVPPGVTEFNTWREKTTVYHEGVPGHHLQIAQAVADRDRLNDWRRGMCFVSGNGEGWALYAEQLMDELGYLSDPGDRLGMLDAQRMRAARVVFDIGVHLSLPAPAEWGGGTWDADKAWPFLRANVNMPEEFIRFEWLRYLGWPGQAPSYKIGQRLWLDVRAADQAKAAAAGTAWDAKAFHARALSVGMVGLDVLKAAMA